MIRRTILTALAAAILTAGGASVTAAAEQKTVKASAAWVGKGQIFQTDENEALLLGVFGGILYVEDEQGKLDAAEMICPATFDIEIKSGEQEGEGKCIITDKDGDRVFAEWSCDGQKLVSCKGSFKLTSGTGKFKGISGKSSLKARSDLSEILVDLNSGAIVEAGAGILVLPELKYTLP